MLIDVDRLGLGEDKEFEFKQDIKVNGVPAAVNTSGRVTLSEDGYLLKGSIQAELDMKCDLCLKNFKIKLEMPFDEIFSNNVPEDDPEKEYWGYEEKTLDITPAVTANILTNMPMRAVCSENCKGLCPICGHDLNKGDCGCDRDVKDSVFDSLMSLFDEE